MLDSLQTQAENTDRMLPTKEAAKLVGYTADYVGRLAREKKILAEQRGRQWFVGADSLKLFSLEAEAERRLRQEQLRQSRIVERVVGRQKQIVFEKVATAPSLFPVALAETAAVLACIALAASLSWTAKSEALDLQAFSFGAVSVTETLSEAFNLFGFFSEEVEIVQAIEPNQDVGVVIVDTETELEKVREAFSDEVVIEMKNTDTGVITPVFRDNGENQQDDEYLFLMVPVSTGEHMSTDSDKQIEN